jgi:hypothetical protein
MVASMIFGDSWQKKLAKKARASLLKHDPETAIQKQLEQYWDATTDAFVQAVAAIELEFSLKLESLRTLAFSTSPEEIEAELNFARELRDFFGGMPWRSIVV